MEFGCAKGCYCAQLCRTKFVSIPLTMLDKVMKMNQQKNSFLGSVVIKTIAFLFPPQASKRVAFFGSRLKFLELC